MLNEQEVQTGSLHQWTLIFQARTASNSFSIRKFGCPLRHYCICWFGLIVVESPGFLQSGVFGRRRLHGMNSHDGRMMCARKAFLSNLADDDVPDLAEDSYDESESD